MEVKGFIASAGEDDVQVFLFGVGIFVQRAVSAGRVHLGNLVVDLGMIVVRDFLCVLCSNFDLGLQVINGDVFELLFEDASSVFREIFQIFTNSIVLQRQVNVFDRFLFDYFLFLFSEIDGELPAGAVRNVFDEGSVQIGSLEKNEEFDSLCSKIDDLPVRVTV